jgi:hypothetical protein
MVVEAEIKAALGFKGVVGHRQWRKIKVSHGKEVLSDLQLEAVMLAWRCRRPWFLCSFSLGMLGRSLRPSPTTHLLSQHVTFQRQQ